MGPVSTVLCLYIPLLFGALFCKAVATILTLGAQLHLKGFQELYLFHAHCLNTVSWSIPRACQASSLLGFQCLGII